MNHPASFDVLCETACPRHEFCHNSVIIQGYDNYTHCKCLGHEDLDDDPRALQYADGSSGLVKQQSESTFISFKQAVRDHVSTDDIVKFGKLVPN